MAFNYSADAKKAGTILSPHLETLSSASMLIEFENMETAHKLGDVLRGRIKVNFREEFVACDVSLQLVGFLRSHFTNNSKHKELMRLA